jgi:diguanylate cyclase (GGDEF)-like protein
MTAAIVAMGLALTFAVYLLQSNLVSTEFRKLEENQARTDLGRVLQRFDVLLETIDANVYDWAAWDDTYQFAEDNNLRFIDSNLYPETFENFGTDVVAFVDDDFEPLWVKVFDFAADPGERDLMDTHQDAVLETMREFALRIDTGTSRDDQYYSGLFSLGEQPVMFSMRPIIRSDGGGPVNGYLLFGTRLTPSLVEDYREQISVNFDIGSLASRDALKSQGDTAIENASSELMVARRPYLAGQEGGFLVTAYLPRHITQTGARTQNRVVGVFLLICLVIALMTWWMLRRNLVAPLQQLKSEVLYIRRTGDWSAQSEVQTQDEIGLLASEFNGMLKTIDEDHSKLTQLNDELSKEQARSLHAQKELERANWELKSLSEKDAVTGLFNRLALERKLDWDWSTLGRTGQPLSMLFVDIDLFKQYNDHYGHQAGDDCLRRVAIVMESVVRRDADMVARYGGEEFMILLPNTGKDEAHALGCHLLEVIRDEAIEHIYSPYDQKLTVSIGVASAVPAKNISVQWLIETADRALYLAKHNGRARVEEASLD